MVSPVGYRFMFSFMLFAGLNPTTRLSGMLMAWPVRGFRPCRAVRVLVEKVPNP